MNEYIAYFALCEENHKNDDALVRFKYMKERDARIAKALGLRV